MAASFDVGAAVARAARGWLRGLVRALVVLGGCMALFALWVAAADKVVTASVAAAFCNVVMFGWLEANVVDSYWPSFPAVHGILALCVCYVATGYLVSAHYARGGGFGRSVAVRHAVFALVLALGLTVGHMRLRDMLPGWWDELVVLGPLLCLEAWVACRLWLVIPVLVVERTTVRRALVRSFMLTRGATLRILAIVLALAAIPVGGLLYLRVRPDHTYLVPYWWLLDPDLWVLWISGFLVTTLQASLAAETYRVLQDARDGTTVARVFE